MSNVNQRFGLAVFAAVLVIGLGVPDAGAQARRVGGFGTSVAQSSRGINPYFQVAPGLNIQQAAFNIRTMGGAFSQFPPYALGFAAPYGLGYAPGSFTANNPGVPLPGTAQAIANSAALNPRLSVLNPYGFNPSLYGGYRPYSPGSGPGYSWPLSYGGAGVLWPSSPYSNMTPYGQSLMTTAAPGELSGYGTDSGGYPGWGRLEQQQQPGDRYLKTALGGSGVLDGDGALKWPVALTALPDAEAARLRKDIQAALESAAARRERGQSATAALRGVAPAVKQLTAMLYAKKGEITDESYQESLRFLRKLNEAARDLR